MNTRFFLAFINCVLLMSLLTYYADYIIHLTSNNPFLNILVMAFGFILFIYIPDFILGRFLGGSKGKCAEQSVGDDVAYSVFHQNRYMVMSSKDIAHGLTSDEQKQLETIFSKVWAYRNNAGIPDLVCVVVEKDWPEYPVVHDLLQKRVDEEKGHEI